MDVSLHCCVGGSPVCCRAQAEVPLTSGVGGARRGRCVDSATGRAPPSLSCGTEGGFSASLSIKATQSANTKPYPVILLTIGCRSKGNLPEKGR